METNTNFSNNGKSAAVVSYITIVGWLILTWPCTRTIKQPCQPITFANRYYCTWHLLYWVLLLQL